MPPLIPIIAAVVGSTFVATMIVTAIEMVAMMLLTKILAPSANQGSTLSDGTTQEYSGTVEPRRIVYGEQLVSGLNAIPPWCHGSNNEMLDQLLVLAGHEVDAITDCYANQELILSSAIGPITQSSNDGRVASGTYANHLWLRRHTGAAGELGDQILSSAWPAAWDGAHMGAGLAKLFIQYQYDTTVYSGGKPQIRARVRGKKVYDPRLDPAPGASPSNPAYIRYSKNPALCIVDYLLDPILGLGETPARIDWLMAVSAANYCDELVAVPLVSGLTPPYDPQRAYVYADTVLVGDTVYLCILASYNVAPPNAAHWQVMPQGSLTQLRHTCNLVMDSTADFETVNIPALAATMQGWVLYSSGKWVLLPGRWNASTFAIGDDDVIGAFSFQTAFAYKDRYNAVRGQFYDPDNLYQPAEYPPIQVMADEIADGEGPVWLELQQPACSDQFEAQRNAIIKQRQSRRKKTFSFTASYHLYSIRPGDFGTLSISELGIAGLPVKCTGWHLDGKAMAVQMTLAEVAPSDWFDPDPAVYQTTTNLATPAPATFIPGPVTQLTGSGGAGGVTLHWKMPAIWQSNLSVEVVQSDTDDYNEGLIVWSGVNTGVYLAQPDIATRYFWVQVRNFAGNTLSAINPANQYAGLALAATEVVGTQGPKGDPGPQGIGGLSGELSLPAATLPADEAGHVPSYQGVVGRYRVFEGVTDVTSLCQFTLSPGGNASGLDYILNTNISLDAFGENVEGTLTGEEAQITRGHATVMPE